MKIIFWTTIEQEKEKKKSIFQDKSALERNTGLAHFCNFCVCVKTN